MTLTHSTLIHLIQLNLTEYCLLSNNIYDYHIVSQGKVTVASIDDAEEFILTDVMLQFLNVFFFFQFTFGNNSTKFTKKTISSN